MTAHFRLILLYYFRKGKNAWQTHKPYTGNKGSVTGRPVEFDEAHIKKIKIKTTWLYQETRFMDQLKESL